MQTSPLSLIIQPPPTFSLPHILISPVNCHSSTIKYVLLYNAAAMSRHAYSSLFVWDFVEA